MVTQRISNDHIGLDIGLSSPWLLFVITTCCALGFLLVGFDNGILGGLVETENFLISFNHPSAATTANIVSLYEIGCFFGAIATFVFGDPLGRRKTIILGCVIMIAGAILQSSAHSVAVMISGRIVSGIGMGTINSTIPILQTEMSPALSRGKLVALDLTVLNIGIAASYWIDYAFNFSHLRGSVTWRLPIALQCVFILGVLFTALIIPDTPRWLVARGRKEEAQIILQRLLGVPMTTSSEVQEMFHGIEEAIDHERCVSGTGWTSLLAPGGGGKDDVIQSRRRLLIACFIQAAQQGGGINSIVFYSSTLFTKSIGLGRKDAALMAGGLNMCLILGSTISIFLIDRVGRRKLLLPCIAAMSAIMISQTVLIKKVQEPNSNPVYGRAASSMLFLFDLFFSVGFQATVWLIPSEILPLHIRTKGSSLSTAANWITNFAIVKMTPSAIENIKWKTYIIFAVLNFTWLPIIYLFLPETKGMCLEDIDALFARDRWQVDDLGRERRASLDSKGAALPESS